MKRVNGMVSDDAKAVLITWKRTKGVTTLDEALEDLLLEFARMKADVAAAKEEANHIDELEQVLELERED